MSVDRHSGMRVREWRPWVRYGPVESDARTRTRAQEASNHSHDAGQPEAQDLTRADCGQRPASVPDGGWGWLVVAGSFLIMMLVPLLGPCFGVLFSRFLLQEGSSSTTTAWIFNVQCFVWNMMGLVVRPLAKEFGWRNIAIKGVLLTSVSVIMSAFTPSAEFLFFSFSLLSGKFPAEW
ncbi:monocarboxylate transporter 12-B [Procambarus clarkii]|uniref:monocarboxylate transporter 12-B n=1 Tax=Procambarus clarkii TaxID=6728 RepID=UPI003743D0F3